MRALEALKAALMPHKSKTEETIAASRAARRIMLDYVEEGRTVAPEDIRTVDRVLAPPVDWNDLIRPNHKQQIRNGA